MIKRPAGSLAIFALLLALLSACGGDDPAGPFSPGVQPKTLRVLTFNLWHGLNPKGVISFEEYETPAGREARLKSFLRQARDLDPDVLLLQEVNPLPQLTGRIAEELGFDAVFAIDNAGVKIGPVGFPTNFRSGLAILARKNLGLKKLGARKLSGPPGIVSRAVCLQFAEFRFVLAAKVRLAGRDVLLLNAHLHHGSELTAERAALLLEMVANGIITAKRSAEIAGTIGLASKRRRLEMQRALDFVRDLGMENAPTIFGGDFNATPGAPELDWLLKAQGFSSATGDGEAERTLFTWDYQRNANTHFIEDFVPVNTFEPAVSKRMNRLEIGLSRRLDYVFFRNLDGFLTATDAGLFGDAPHDGRMASDHFGIFAVFTP